MTKPIARNAKQIGIDDDLYELLLRNQDGHCAICPSEPKTRRLNVDHDHKTGMVRGLLCHRCNRALPAWITPSWLRNAADYMEIFSQEKAPPPDATPLQEEVLPKA